jgi:hypothetical protein
MQGIWHLGRFQPAVHFLIWIGRNNAKSHFLFGSGFDRRGGVHVVPTSVDQF